MKLWAQCKNSSSSRGLPIMLWASGSPQVTPFLHWTWGGGVSDTEAGPMVSLLLTPLPLLPSPPRLPWSNKAAHKAHTNKLMGDFNVTLAPSMGRKSGTENLA